MSDAQWIWRFGRWAAERPHGSITLSWSEGDLVLKVAGGRIVGVEGLDPGIVGATAIPPSSDLLKESVALARRRGLRETDGLAAVKEAVEDALAAWLADPERKLTTVEEASPQEEGPTISLSHAIVETILVRGDDSLPRVILPDLHVVLRRAPGFLERYASLQLSEEADLIVAKITGQRTAEEIVQRTPHDQREVLALLAALVAAGLLEPVPVATPDPELADDILLKAPSPEESAPRRFSGRWILAIAAVVLVILIGAAIWLSGARDKPSRAPSSWGVVVDRGCEPQDLQRILSKAGRFPDSVRAERSNVDQKGPCWQLVWGHFATREEAQKAVAGVPRVLRHRGLDPEVVPLEEHAGAGIGEKGGDNAQH